VDLIFLDIEMPQMTGLEFVKSLGEHLPQIIITTTHEKFALEAFKYDISGYLLKPVKFKEFCDALNKIEKKLKKEKELDFNENYVFIRNGKTIDKIKKEDLRLIECIGDYATIYTADKKYVVHSTMKALEKRFSGNDFLRVHRSYIIHIDAINDIEDDSISFGEKIVPIGKTYLNAVYKRLNIL